TPLFRAAQKGYDGVVKLLLLETRNVNVNWESKQGQTPLLWAREGGRKEMVELLLKAGAKS
ncbi:hypothetical protein MMC31_002561, partial [Peltigera leucophlebia]|nr:hypothetical protein [Peltigera leucophlebia]